MPNDANFLDIILLGKEYRVACPPDQHAALLNAASHVDGKMRDIAEKTRNNIAERIAVMAALNIAHEHLGLDQGVAVEHQKIESEIGLDMEALRRRISSMEADIDAVLKSE
ncbi:MAG TPA: cell division protein ZapA [Candidatus Accumulibacter phosphatis]|nr:MAG: Z ring-associated protein ZapA [Candidatus Accumulibacter sp. SK-11]HAY28710.1 cell division protein ZapA [Accumulibacter sp.]HRL75404.1 cell division protein ZapA [Candidatus Accumulibacter phosphatis]HCN66859.1 cell division protein ZapA [Accumulibacter sp.]HCV14313.1 cell division protein ZapA [Accumulibacter sp.]